MKKQSISLIGYLLLAGLVGGILTACGHSPTPVPAATALVQSSSPTLRSTDVALQNTDTPASSAKPSAQVAAAGDGLTLLQQRCSACHDPNLVSRFQGTASDWKMVVDAMIANGAQLNSAEEQVLVNYLAQTYHP